MTLRALQSHAEEQSSGRLTTRQRISQRTVGIGRWVLIRAPAAADQLGHKLVQRHTVGEAFERAAADTLDFDLIGGA